MCALFGWLDYKHIVPYKTLKKLTQALANAAEEHGTDAAGISYIKGGKITILKRPKPAHKIRFNAPDVTTAIMGHTRLTTQGNQKFNQNNHPFYGHADRDFALAHNGVLYNDFELRKANNLPDTNIETDSYVAVQLIELQGKLDFNSLKNMAETIRGNFTFTVLDEENSLYIIKGSNPMCLLHFEMLGLYIYASTESIMKNALRKVNMLSFPYTKIETVHGDIIKIDSNGIITRSEFEGKEDFRYASWLKYYDDFEDDYYNQHEQLLLDMCNCYGVDEDDIILLLDYGYSADEIEDMLCDYSLITDTVKAVKKKVQLVDIGSIAVKPTIFGNKVTLDKNDYDKLQALAEKEVVSVKQTRKLSAENKRLSEENAALKSTVDQQAAELAEYRKPATISVKTLIKGTKETSEKERLASDLQKARSFIADNGLSEAFRRYRPNTKKHELE